MGLESVAAPLAIGMSGFGAMQEARSQQKANAAQMQQAYANMKMQSDRDLANYEMSKDFTKQEKEHRDTLLRMMTEGYRDDATGIRTRYVPGEGQVTSYSPEANEAIQSEARENLLRLIQDAPRARRGREANEMRRMEEGRYADQVLGDMRGPDPFDSKRIIADLISARRRGVNEGFDKTQSAQITSDIRTGTGSNAMLAELARERSRALSDAEAGGYTEGLGVSEDLRGARTSRLGNLYNLIASRASNTEDVPFAPQTLSSNAQNAAFARNPASAGGANVGRTSINPGAQGFDLNAIKANPSLFGPMANTIYGLGKFDTNRTQKSQNT